LRNERSAVEAVPLPDPGGYPRLMSKFMIIAVVALVASCADEQPQQQNEQAPSSTAADPNPPSNGQENEAVAPPEPGTPGGLSDDRTPLNEKIDPKGPEGAAQIVQQFSALFEQRRFADARKLWGEKGVPEDSAAFVSQLESYRQVHAEIGAPSEAEGAAGSVYVTVPLVFYGRRAGGEAFRQSANATLRRVNEVPGSTAAQRQWHLQRLAPA